MAPRLRGDRIGRIALLCAAAMTIMAAPPVSAADPPPCRVRNVTQDTTGESLATMVAAAQEGDTLHVRGRCRGPIVIAFDLSISGVGDGTTITGRDRDRVVEVLVGATVMLQHLTLRGGAAPSGGAIRNAGEMALRRVTIKDNRSGPRNRCGLVPDPTCDYRRTHAKRGGGILNDGTMTISHSRVRGNEAGLGGGIFNRGTLTVVDSTISRNVAALWSESGGGGIFNTGDLVVSRSTIAANATVSGEGYAVGGGIFNSGRLVVGNSTLSRNLAYGQNGGESGAIANGSEYMGTAGDILVRQTTVTENVARSWRATSGAAIGSCPAESCGGTGNAVIERSLVAGNDWDCVGTFTSEGHNLIGAARRCRGFEDGVAHDQVGTVRDPVHAMLGPLADNGGPTRTHLLLRGSPAIDTAGGAPCATSKDQRGVRRPQGRRCDIGAIERAR